MMLLGHCDNEPWLQCWGGFQCELVRYVRGFEADVVLTQAIVGMPMGRSLDGSVCLRLLAAGRDFQKTACARKWARRVGLSASFDSQLPRQLFIFRLVALAATVILKNAVSRGAFLPCEREAQLACPRS